MFIIGFTGTRKGMTNGQKKGVQTLLDMAQPIEVHHGDCIGADQDFHDIVTELLSILVIVHPPSNNQYRAFVNNYWSIHPAKPYLQRNHDIVNACNLLLACPAQEEEQLRSGTWATVRYARKLKKNIYLIYPSGIWMSDHRR